MPCQSWKTGADQSLAIFVAEIPIRPEETQRLVTFTETANGADSTAPTAFHGSNNSNNSGDDSNNRTLNPSCRLNPDVAPTHVLIGG